MRILITGANGFVGRTCCARFVRAGVEVIAAVRTDEQRVIAATHTLRVGDVDGSTDWSRALRGVDAVIHLVAITHGRDNADPTAYARYQRVNVEGTRALAMQARAAGVRRFVLLSSIKVNGEGTLRPVGTFKPYAAGDAPAPRDNYGRSKLEAERCVQALAVPAAFEPVILRPPLIYGPGQPGNLFRLMRWIEAGRPLPLAGVHNRRSLIYVGNLADALLQAAMRPGVGPEPLPIADIDLSSADLAAAMAFALDVRLSLIRVPGVVFRLLAMHPRGRALVERLCGSLQVDARAARAALDWTPGVGLAEAMRETVAAFRSAGQ